MRRVLTVFGTRPEAIKLGPVVAELSRLRSPIRTINVLSGQHRDLVRPFLHAFGMEIAHDLTVMQPSQTPIQTCARILDRLEPVLRDESPDLVLVQGDTSTVLAGALAAFHAHVPVGHVEAGLRSGHATNPFPEEMNRRLVSRLATYHFAATADNRKTLIAEGVGEGNIFLTGNPVVQALDMLREASSPSAAITALIDATRGFRRLVITTHRREHFGDVLAAHLRVFRRFVDIHDDVAVLFPVHPNPEVRGPAEHILGGHPRIHLLGPLDYRDFIALLESAWLIASDSGGVQEEAPSLGKPVLVMRATTERSEALAAGVARLTHGDPSVLAEELEALHADDDWVRRTKRVPNPFGSADSGARIAEAIDRILTHGVNAGPDGRSRRDGA